MAKEYRWFKISEANAEIDRLEKELTSAKASAAAVVENDSEIANQASRLQKEVDSLKDQISKHDAVVAAITAERDATKAKADTELKAANDKLASFDAEVKKLASAEAGKIVEAQGVPPISAKQSENPAGAQKTELTGLARVKASFETELAANK